MKALHITGAVICVPFAILWWKGLLEADTSNMTALGAILVLGIGLGSAALATYCVARLFVAWP